MISNIYAQCDDYSESQCNNDNSCEWVEDIETGNCGNLSGDDCELNPECNWNCDFVDDYMGWCNYSCDGGPYEIDNSYCQENPNPPTCSEMSQIQCNSNSECEWIDNPIETGSCSELSLSVCDLPEYGSCYSYCTNWGYYYNCTGGTICTGGSYEIDNSYCQENPNPPTCSEMSQIQCNNNSDCQWTEDIEFGHCSDFSSWQCGYVNDECWGDLCYGGSYGSWSFCCRGGSYEIDNSYCEDSDIIQGDLNYDMTLNILDVIIVVDIILNQESSDLADMNEDGVVNISDIIILVQIIIY